MGAGWCIGRSLPGTALWILRTGPKRVFWVDTGLPREQGRSLKWLDSWIQMCSHVPISPVWVRWSNALIFSSNPRICCPMWGQQSQFFTAWHCWTMVTLTWHALDLSREHMLLSYDPLCHSWDLCPPKLGQSWWDDSAMLTMLWAQRRRICSASLHMSLDASSWTGKST